MNTVSELKETLLETEKRFGANPDFLRLRDFYEEMKRRGLVRKQDYSLPPLDTTGQGLYREKSEALPATEEELAARHGFEP